MTDKERETFAKLLAYDFGYNAGLNRLPMPKFDNERDTKAAEQGYQVGCKHALARLNQPTLEMMQ